MNPIDPALNYLAGKIANLELQAAMMAREIETQKARADQAEADLAKRAPPAPTKKS